MHSYHNADALRLHRRDVGFVSYCWSEFSWLDAFGGDQILQLDFIAWSQDLDQSPKYAERILKLYFCITKGFSSPSECDQAACQLHT